MKKKYLSVAVILAVTSSIMFTSCIGSFKLSNKVLAWNKQIGSKFVNELVFVAFWILPVYEISAVADVLVLNTIEFWSGSNPVAETKIIDGKDAKYQVERDMAGYTITNLSDKSIVRFDFNEADKSWSVSSNGSESKKFMQFVDETHVNMISPDGSLKPVEISQDGVYAYQQMVTTSQFAMAH